MAQTRRSPTHTFWARATQRATTYCIADSETRDAAEPEYTSRLGRAGVEGLHGARISGRARMASQRAQMTSGQVAVGSQLEEQMETTATEASLGETTRSTRCSGFPAPRPRTSC